MLEHVEKVRTRVRAGMGNGPSYAGPTLVAQK